MDNFIVSARKYRPDTFNSVVGQSSITTTLKNSIKTNHLAHAYLFCGPRGVGKTTCARIFAKTINCKNITDKIEACNECESCLGFNKASSFNIHELDAASNNTVDGIRTLIEQVRIPPQVGDYSIYIIDEVHMLSSQAFNAFLKTLEEPPAHAIFILATTEKHKIIPTILSRCQIFDFNRIKVDDIVEHLKYVAKNENINADPDGLTIIAQKADGALRDALSIFDQIVSFSGTNFSYQNVIDNLNVLDYDYYFQLTDAFLENNISGSLLIFNKILENGFDAQNFINGLNQHFRDILVCKDTETISLLEVGDNIKDKYKVQALKCNMEFLYKGLDILSKADINYKTSNNKRLHTELALIQLCSIIKNNAVKTQLPVDKTPTDKKSHTAPKPESKPETTLQNKAEEPKTQENKQDIKQEPSTSKTYEQSTHSIKNLLKDDWDDNPTEKIKADSPKSQNNDFTLEQLKSKWNDFASEYSAEKRKYIILNNPDIELTEKTNILFNLSSNLQKATFEKELMSEITLFLQKELQNNNIKIKTGIKAKPSDKEETMLYSDRDKYNYMAKKNPKLNDLRSNLKLDF